MQINRQRIPQAVWFALMLGLPVAASACREDTFGEKVEKKVDKAVDQAKDVGEDVGDKAEDVVDKAEDELDKTK